MTVYCKSVWQVNPFHFHTSAKNGARFTWGAKQQATFDQIKHYLSQEGVIGVVLTQEFKAKEHIITYEVKGYWTLKQGTLLLRSCDFHYIMLVLN
jgi:hypothetical protein